MKNILLFLSFLLFPFLPSAQTWCAPGSTWYYGQVNGFGFDGYLKITYVGDTIINTITCKKLLRNEYDYNQMTSTYSNFVWGTSYTYADSNKVYMYAYKQFYTLYDFSALPGATWKVPGPIYYSNACDSTGKIRVDSVGTMMINSQHLRYICVSVFDSSQQWGYSAKIVEKIGPIKTLPSNTPCGSYLLPEKNYMAANHCGIAVDQPTEGSNFRCYHDSSSFNYPTDTASVDCDYIYTGTGVPEITKNVGIKIFPNPTTNNLLNVKINFQANDLTYHIYNIVGQEIANGNFNSNETNTIPTDKLPCGIYVFIVKNNEKQLALKFVKE